MGLVYEYLTYDGKASTDFNVQISGGGTFNAPQRDVESISIPGRNGDLHIDNGRFNNVEITYNAFCVKDFDKNYGAFKAFLGSKRGYKRLEDSYHPEYYRRAAYSDGLTPKMSTLNRAGSFDIVFDCDPRCFYKSGEEPIEIASGGKIKNPFLYASLPIIRVYGTGILTVKDVQLAITAADEYTDIDCELQEAYKGDVNCNANITLTDEVFPTLKPGINTINYTAGISKVIITPNWWSV